MPTYVRTQEIAHPIGARGRFALRVTSPEVELRAGHGTQATARIQFELRADSEEEADELFERVRYRVRQGDGLLEVSEPRKTGAGIGSIVRLLVTGSARVGVVHHRDASPITRRLRSRGSAPTSPHPASTARRSTAPSRATSSSTASAATSAFAASPAT